MKTSFKKLAAIGVMISVLTTGFVAEAEWTGVAVKRTTAYTDSSLTRRNGTEYVDAGDTITVLQETGNAYYVRYPLSRGGYKERWVSKDVFGNASTNTQAATATVANYQQWQGYSPNRLTAYTNAALTTRNANEWVGAGDTVTVLNESGNAYYVRYPLTRGGYKDRWVSKSGIQRSGNNNVAAATASAGAQGISQAISASANYQQWQGYSPNRLTAYTNAVLTTRNANEWVGAGDTVTVLNESGNAYYVRYPLTRGGYKDRWVNKSGIQRSGNNNVAAATASAGAQGISQAISASANYQQWQGYSPNRLTAYTNATLTTRNANEWVGAGDTVTVLSESGNAYYVRYPLTRGGYKERWVSKSGIQRSGNNNVAAATASAGAQGISQAISASANYQQWQGYSPNRLTAYTNAALTTRNANEWVGAGDTVTVLNESGNAYYVRYPLTRGGYKDRWVSKRGIQRTGDVQSNGTRATGLNQAAAQQTATRNAAQNLSRNTAKASSYQQWQGYCPNRLTAYTNSALTTRNANEWVGAGDTVTVLAEEGNAYFVSYPLTKGGTKERWVNKRGIQINTPNNQDDKTTNNVVISEIGRTNNLQELINIWNGGTWQDHYYLPGVIQCKEFASYIFYQLHGIDYIGPTKDKPGNYEINLSYPNKVGIRGTQAYLNDNTAKLLFQNAQPGDFVQMKRHHGGSHSAIVASKNNEGVEFFEANVPKDNIIRTKFFTWHALTESNAAMAVYYAK